MGPMGKPVGFSMCAYVCELKNTLSEKEGKVSFLCVYCLSSQGPRGPKGAGGEMVRLNSRRTRNCQ